MKLTAILPLLLLIATSACQSTGTSSDAPPGDAFATVSLQFET